MAFAAIVGRFINTLSQWLLERGATIGFLKQITGSETVGSTITSQVSPRANNLSAAMLIALWPLSPRGSQTALRVLSLTHVTNSHGVPSRVWMPCFHPQHQRLISCKCVTQRHQCGVHGCIDEFQHL